jgi:hypothetical protein
VIATTLGIVASGWPEVGFGLLIIAVAVLIHFGNRLASAALGTGGRHRRMQRIGAGVFIALGILMVIVGVVHLL